jgi:predicted PurR-regulated permease PerM
LEQVGRRGAGPARHAQPGDRRRLEVSMEGPGIMTQQRRISYVVMLVLFLLAGWLHMVSLLMAALFSYFALTKLQFSKRMGKWPTVVLFAVLVVGVVLTTVHFLSETIVALPSMADKAIPSMMRWAEKYGLVFPFQDYDSLKTGLFELAREHVGSLNSVATFARGATRQLVFLLIGCVCAISLFINARFELDRESNPNPNNLYYLSGDELTKRFTLFYRSFAIVMGAQMTISVINTVLTAIFILALGLPHPLVIIGITFLCGLVPIIGNLVSNSVIVATGFTRSPETALAALVFLVVVHKLEYLLNSKIIGERIRNPVWLTLLGLVLGEKLMGIPGMVLAPVVLHYLKMEIGKVPLKKEPTPIP